VRRHKTQKNSYAMLEGRQIVSVQRRGKYLVIRLDGPEAPDRHLGMSVQASAREVRAREDPKHTTG